MHQLIQQVENKNRKARVVDVRSGDTVRVHQKIKEGSKERVQVFEGFVIRTRRKNSSTSTITVRRIASGVGVEKTFMLHSPLVVQVEVTKRSKVRRKYLSYMRERSGKSARLTGVDFDKDSVNLSVEEQQNVDAGLDKDADIEEVEAEAKAAEAPAEEAKKEEKPAEETKEEKTEEPVDAPEEKSDEKPEKMSKEEKAKLKKEKAKAFQEEKESN